MAKSNRRKLLNVKVHKLYLPPDIIRIKGEMKEGEWLGHVQCVWHETCIQGYQKSLIIMNNQLRF